MVIILQNKQVRKYQYNWRSIVYNIVGFLLVYCSCLKISCHNLSLFHSRGERMRRENKNQLFSRTFCLFKVTNILNPRFSKLCIVILKEKTSGVGHPFINWNFFIIPNLIPTFCDRHNILLVDIIINDIFDRNFAISYLPFLFVCFFNKKNSGNFWGFEPWIIDFFFHLYLTYLWCFKKFWSVVLFANGTNLFFAHTEILDRRKWTLVAYTC